MEEDYDRAVAIINSSQHLQNTPTNSAIVWD